MDQKLSNKTVMQLPISTANRFIWAIKDFTEYQKTFLLQSPEFVVNTINGVEEKVNFEITDRMQLIEDLEDDDYDTDNCDDEAAFILCINCQFDTVRTLDIVYSILDKNGRMIYSERKKLIRVQPKIKMRKKLWLMERQDMKDLIFENGIIVMHICIVDVTVDETIIKNLLNNDNDEINEQAKIINHFTNFYETKVLSDFIIKVEEKEFHVHKFALAASSPVFATLFIRETKRDSDNGSIVITDATSQVVQEMINYIYTGSVNNMEQIAKDLLKIAHLYNIDGLVKMCVNHLKTTISVENVLNILAFATKYMLEDLKFSAQIFFITNTKKILNGKEFNDFINSFAYSFDIDNSL